MEKEGRSIQPKKHSPHCETQWWEYYTGPTRQGRPRATMGMLQCVWNWESCLGRRNHGKKTWKSWKKTESSQQHNNGPKHMLLLEKNYPQKTKVNIIDHYRFTAQSPDLNFNENLRGKLKTNVHARRPSNLEEINRFSQKRMCWDCSGDVWDLLETTAKNCRLVSGIQDTQLTISIRG